MSVRSFAPRRAAMAVIAAGAIGLTASVAVLASVPRDGDIGFKVVRGDSPMGEHRLSFARSDAGLEVSIDIELGVDFGPFTVYEYTHQNREVWQDGQLISLTSQTDDNGDEHFVRVERTDQGLRIETKDGVTTAPGDIVPTSYWNYEIVQADRVLDTQKGRILEVSTRLMGGDEVWVEGQAVPARRYQMTGDLNLDIWYDADNEWVKTAFEIKGEQIEYFRGGVPEDLEQASFFLRDEQNELPFGDVQRSAR